MIHFCFFSFYSCDQTSLTIFAYQVLDNVTLTCPYFIILLFILSNSVYCKLQILFSFFFFNSYSFFYCIILLLHHKADKCMFLFFSFRYFTSQDIYIKYFFHYYTYICFLQTISKVSFLTSLFLGLFRRFFRKKQNGIFLALEEKIHFSTFLFLFYSLLSQVPSNQIFIFSCFSSFNVFPRHRCFI